MILYHGTNADFGEIDLRKSNRNNASSEPAHDYDIVIGPIANDRVGVQLWKFENGTIDLSTLVHNLRNMKGITFQYFFGTERAIKILKRL